MKFYFIFIIFIVFAINCFRHRNISPQTLYSEYRCYLNCARIKITECAMETKHWTYLYDGEDPPYTIGKNRFTDVFSFVRPL